MVSKPSVLLSGKKVALPPLFCLSHLMHFEATSSSPTTMLLSPFPNAVASASSWKDSLELSVHPKSLGFRIFLRSP